MSKTYEERLDEALDKLEQRHLYNVLTDSDTESSIAKIKDAYQAAFIAGAKFREAQLLEIVNEVKNSLKFIHEKIGACAYGQNDKWGVEMESVYRTSQYALTSVNKTLDEMGIK